MSLLTFLPIIIVSSGGYLLLKLRFFFITHPKSTLRFAFSGKNKKDSILSLILALAGTLGVGNISGVAIGIAIGGAGSVFWLVLSTLFSSAIKYSEVHLSYRAKGGGMIGVIRGAFKRSGSFFASVYALTAVILSFSMGSIFQARAISESAGLSGGGALPFAVFLTFIAFFISIAGKDRLKNAVALLIPFAALSYTGICLFVVLSNLGRVPEVMALIFSKALSARSTSGGLLGFIVSSGMKEGFARGLLSNEAGAGTSSFSHTSHVSNTPSGMAEADTVECERAGIFGILEVFFDTLLICPLTALTILLGYEGDSFSGSLGELSFIFERHIGSLAPGILLLSILLFALSTTLCWYYYGRVALSHLIEKRGVFLYTLLYFLSFFAAILHEIPHVLFVTDTALFILTVISLSAVIKSRAHLEFKDALGNVYDFKNQ